MDRLDAMRIFIAAAEGAGFAGAARRLNLSPPSVTRAVALLEDRLGTALFQRSTRHVRLTEAGERFLADARRILAELEEAEASAAGLHGAPRGQLSITASLMFGRRHVAPVVLDFLDHYPDVSARLLLLDRVTNLIEEGFDVAVRIAHLQDSSLSAVRVGHVRPVVVASPDYIARHGAPLRPRELMDHTCLLFAPPIVAEGWHFRDEMIEPPSRFFINSAEAVIAAAVAGRGVTRVLSYMVAPEVQAGKLQVLLAEHERPPIPVHLLHAEGRRANAKLRAFIDFAAERLRANPVLQN
ncbi:LysR family transcriptional regulator [Ferrovibrio sp.]|uniref:LysR family transcriptional regulator n=1 Tax=Ferrovibrio sp. TaxID=1917215 RepID=UPI0026100565|nr:LysR family transcriptional regulator [Ferrovibrio sp.]